VRYNEAAEQVNAALSRAYADSTNAGDDGHWRAWVRVCTHMNTSPWRTDIQANLGLDPEGHQEELFLLATACICMYDDMRPRRRSDPAADPRSALKKLEAVRRRHAIRQIEMAPLRIVRLLIRGLCRMYIDAYGIDTLIPERKLPFSDTILRGLLNTPQGASRGALTVDWTSYYWTAVQACFATLAEEGSRKDEVAKESAKAPFRKGRFTFDSLRFKLGASAQPVASGAAIYAAGRRRAAAAWYL